MRILFMVVTVGLGLMMASCNSGNDRKEQEGTVETPKGDSLVAHSASDSEFVLPAKDTSHVTDMNWRDSMLVDFISGTKNTAIAQTRKDKVGTQWIMDNLTKTDTADYYIYHLGHSFEGRFVTDAWVYIDSARRKLYEYDVAEDRLIKWK